jgi:hypothetical protein
MSKTLRVADIYRKSPLSKIPGGYDIEICYSNGDSKIYSKIKDPEKYYNSAKRCDDSIVTYNFLGPSK